MSEKAERRATLRLNSREKPTVLRVTLPHRITEPELAKLNAQIVHEIIRPHTGCTCLSGTINVLFESQYQEAMHVEL